jgi:hypothetical protein
MTNVRQDSDLGQKRCKTSHACVVCTLKKYKCPNVVYLGLPIALLYMSQNAGGGGVTGSQQMITAVHIEPKYTLEI